MFVTVYLNQNTRDSFIKGYSREHTLTEVFTYETAAPPISDALNEGFELLNVGHDPVFTNGAPDPRAVAYRLGGHRSLSVGDVLVMEGYAYAVASSGFTELGDIRVLIASTDVQVRPDTCPNCNDNTVWCPSLGWAVHS